MARASRHIADTITDAVRRSDDGSCADQRTFGGRNGARDGSRALADVDAPSAADVYGRLRQAFPLAPLSARVGALAALMEKIRRPAA